MTGRLDKLQSEFDIEIKWRAFPLRPDMPIEGKTLEEVFADYPFNVEDMKRNVKNTAESLGLPFGNRTHTYNTRLAQEVGLWAEAQGKGESFHMAAFMAYFVDGKNLGLIEELLLIIESIDLPVDEARNVMESRSFQGAVDDDWAHARNHGIQAIPTFMMNGVKLVGAQDYETLANMVNRQMQFTQTD